MRGADLLRAGGGGRTRTRGLEDRCAAVTLHLQVVEQVSRPAGCLSMVTLIGSARLRAADGDRTHRGNHGKVAAHQGRGRKIAPRSTRPTPRCARCMRRMVRASSSRPAGRRAAGGDLACRGPQRDRTSCLPIKSRVLVQSSLGSVAARPGIEPGPPALQAGASTGLACAR